MSQEYRDYIQANYSEADIPVPVKPCPDCGGKGLIGESNVFEELNECNRCSGQGEIEVPPQATIPVGVLHDIFITMRHARTFITSREKMHPTGVELWDKLFAQVEALQASSLPSPEGK